MILSPHFTDEEFRCECCGDLIVDARLVMALEEMRRIANTPIYVTSGYRCERHNAEVGGEKNSQHLTGRAADISSRIGVDRLRSIAQGIAWVNGIGYDPARGFLHVDVRSGQRAEWKYLNGKAVGAR